MSEGYDNAVKAVELIVSDQMSEAMNEYNRKKEGRVEMQAFLEPLKELADYQEIVSSRRKKTGFLQIAGCVNSQKIHLAKALSDGFEYRVIVFSSEEKSKTGL